MMRFNRLFDSRFKNCKQIGYKDDPHTGRRLRVYALPENLVEKEEINSKLVGIDDGLSCWIGSLSHCLHDMKMIEGEEPRARVKLKTAGSTTERRRIHVRH